MQTSVRKLLRTKWYFEEMHAMNDLSGYFIETNKAIHRRYLVMHCRELECVYSRLVTVPVSVNALLNRRT
jgi:hypothetical protein